MPKVKNPPGMQAPKEMWVQSLGWKDPLEEEMATHFIMPAWKISWAPQRILAGYSPWGLKEPDRTEHTGNSVILTPRVSFSFLLNTVSQIKIKLIF